MKKYLALGLFVAGMLFLCAGPAFAPLVTVEKEKPAISAQKEADTVDLSDVDEDAPVQSPSFANETAKEDDEE